MGNILRSTGVARVFLLDGPAPQQALDPGLQAHEAWLLLGLRFGSRGAYHFFSQLGGRGWRRGRGRGRDRGRDRDWSGLPVQVIHPLVVPTPVPAAPVSVFTVVSLVTVSVAVTVTIPIPVSITFSVVIIVSVVMTTPVPIAVVSTAPSVPLLVIVVRRAGWLRWRGLVVTARGGYGGESLCW